jgi:hypothetical protein
VLGWLRLRVEVLSLRRGRRCGCGLSPLLPRHPIPCARRTGRSGPHDRWHFLTDRLAIVVADHHQDVFRLLRRDDIARRLRPIALAALIVADKAGIGAMLARDGDLSVRLETC